SVLAAIATRPRDVSVVRASPSASDTAWRDVVTEAARQGVRVESSTARSRGPRSKSAGKPVNEGRQGGGEADVKPRDDVPLDRLFTPVTDCGLWLAFDHLQDPHNVGAVFRTAAFFGVRGIVMTKDRSA